MKKPLRPSFVSGLDHFGDGCSQCFPISECVFICHQINWEKKVGVIIWYIMMVPFGVYYIYKLVEVS